MNILVVDDDPLVLKSIGRALKFKGFDVDLAESADTALEMMSSKSYETVLSDLSMPRIDGIAFMKQIGSSVKKLFMSGYPQKYIDSGIEFISKPFGVEELVDFINREVKCG